MKGSPVAAGLRQVEERGAIPPAESPSLSCEQGGDERVAGVLDEGASSEVVTRRLAP